MNNALINYRWITMVNHVLTTKTIIITRLTNAEIQEGKKMGFSN